MSSTFLNRQLFQYHPVVGYSFVPGLRIRVPHETGGYLVRTNQTGFRSDHEFESKKPTGWRRILLFGDSYTAGDGVSNKQRFGDVLETMVPNLQVFNFGLSGTGTDQQYLIYKEFATGIECDLIVVALMVENIRRVVARYRPYLTPAGQEVLMAKPYFRLAQSEDTPHDALVLEGVPVSKEPVYENDLSEPIEGGIDRGGRYRLLRKAINPLGPSVKDWVQRLAKPQPLPGYDDPNSADWRLMRAILRKWISESHAPMLLFPIPLYHYLEGKADPSHYIARFQELHNPPRVRVHDPLRELMRRPLNERRRYRFDKDVHPTPEFHRVLATSLAKTISIGATPA